MGSGSSGNWLDTLNASLTTGDVVCSRDAPGHLRRIARGQSGRYHPAMNEPKKASVGLMIAVVAGGIASFLFVGLPLFVLHGGAPARLWHAIQEGGWAALLNLGLALVLGIALPVAAAVFLRVRSVPSVVLLIPPVMIPVIAALAGAFSLGKASDAIESLSVDPSQRARILAEGVAISLTNASQGSMLAAILLGTVAFCLAFRTWTRVDKPGFGLAPGLALGAGLVAAFAFVPAFLLWEPLRWAGFRPWPFVLLSVIVATLAGTGLTKAGPNEKEHLRCAADFWAAAWATLGALAFVSLAIWSSSLILAFGAVGGESVDPSQKVRILAVAWQEARQAFLASGVYLLPAAIAFGAAQAAKLLPAVRGAAGVAVTFAVALPCLGVPLLALSLQTSGIADVLTRMWQPPDLGGVQLAQVPARSRENPSSRVKPCTSFHILSVDAQQVYLDGKRYAPATDLGSTPSCEALVGKLRDENALDAGLAFEATVPFEKARCLADALTAARAKEGRPSYGREGTEWWISTGRAAFAELPAPFNEAKPSPACVRTADEKKTTPERLHVDLTKDAWRVHLNLASTPKTLSGPREARVESLRRLAKEVPSRSMSISASPDVPIEEVLLVASLSPSYRLPVFAPAPGEPDRESADE